MSTTSDAYQRLYEIMARLRAPDGCPWDRAQTPLTMRSDLLEETYEAVEAITDGDALHAREELGDVFLNATMIAYMYEQQGDFCVADSLNEVCDKLVRRHPHVFGENKPSGVDTPDKVLNQWDKIKTTVEGRGGESILDQVSSGLPPLTRACKLQKKASKKGFDWTSPEGVWDKVREEMEEVREAAFDAGSGGDTEEELGDLLFAVVNFCRHVKVDPAVALTRANAKFTRRFRYVEDSMKKIGVEMDASCLSQMDAFWDEAKAAEKKSGE